MWRSICGRTGPQNSILRRGAGQRMGCLRMENSGNPSAEEMRKSIEERERRVSEYSSSRSKMARLAFSCPTKCGWPKMGKFGLRLVLVQLSNNSSGAWRTNAAGDLTPTEIATVTPDGYAVFVQPFIIGRSVSETNESFALDRIGLEVITQMEGLRRSGRSTTSRCFLMICMVENVKVGPNGESRGYRCNQPGVDSEEVKKLQEWRRPPGASETH